MGEKDFCHPSANKNWFWDSAQTRVTWSQEQEFQRDDPEPNGPKDPFCIGYDPQQISLTQHQYQLGSHWAPSAYLGIWPRKHGKLQTVSKIRRTPWTEVEARRNNGKSYVIPKGGSLYSQSDHQNRTESNKQKEIQTRRDKHTCHKHEHHTKRQKIIIVRGRQAKLYAHTEGPKHRQWQLSHEKLIHATKLLTS